MTKTKANRQKKSETPTLAERAPVARETVIHDRKAAALTLAEQERLGRQLHDTFGPQITAISMLAASLHERLQARSADETELAAKLLARIEQAKSDVRALVKGLLPVEVDVGGLMIALDELTEQTEKSYGIACRFECEKPVAVDDNFAATRLFRIAREAVHNAVKHARANEIVVSLTDEDDCLVLQVRDDGAGIRQDISETEGNGIRLMRHRSLLINGTLDIGPGESGGTVVTCSVMKGEDGNA
jgi:two-component system CheB/CheR fusion protein